MRARPAISLADSIRQTASIARSVSVGGILATGLPPFGSPLRGTPAEHVVGIGWVLPDGTRVRGKLTPRSATGPDPDALVLGARGALGVITEANGGVGLVGCT